MRTVTAPGGERETRVRNQPAGVRLRQAEAGRGAWLNRVAALSGLACLVFLMWGCTASGGGVPIGSTLGDLSGQVIEASGPGRPVPGAQLSLITSDGRLYSGTADQDGNYTFPSLPRGPGTMTVSPPAGLNLGPQALRVDITADSLKSVVAALGSSAEYASATGITLSPASLDLRQGQTVPVLAMVTGLNTAPRIQPSLVVSGGVGQVFSGGQFLATHIGTGSITASFGSRSSTIPVVVR